MSHRGTVVVDPESKSSACWGSETQKNCDHFYKRLASLSAMSHILAGKYVTVAYNPQTGEGACIGDKMYGGFCSGQELLFYPYYIFTYSYEVKEARKEDSSIARKRVDIDFSGVEVITNGAAFVAWNKASMTAQCFGYDPAGVNDVGADCSGITFGGVTRILPHFGGAVQSEVYPTRSSDTN